MLANTVKEIVHNIVAEQSAGVSTTDEVKTMEEKGMYQNDQTISILQFELPDKLLPRLNPKHFNMEKRIVLHPMGTSD